MEELKKCPFCGGVANAIQKYSASYNCYFINITCGTCKSSTRGFRSKEQNDVEQLENAINSWNLRYKGE